MRILHTAVNTVHFNHRAAQTYVHRNHAQYTNIAVYEHWYDFIVMLVTGVRQLSRMVTLLIKNHMMTSSNGNIFCVTGHLCGEVPGSPLNSPHKGEWREALTFTLICVWINGWVNNGGWWFEMLSRPLWGHYNASRISYVHWYRSDNPGCRPKCHASCIIVQNEWCMCTMPIIAVISKYDMCQVLCKANFIYFMHVTRKQAQ